MSLTNPGVIASGRRERRINSAMQDIVSEPNAVSINALTLDGTVAIRHPAVPANEVNDVSFRDWPLNGSNVKLLNRPGGRLEMPPHNLVSWSENLANWTKQASTSSGQVVTANGTNAVHGVFRAAVFAIAFFPTCVSADLKAGTHSRVSLVASSPNVSFGAVFDLAAGTVRQTFEWPRLIPTGLSEATITPIGDGWFRCTVSALTITSVSMDVKMQFVPVSASPHTFADNGDTQPWQATGDETFLANRMQYNRGFLPVPYLPTPSSSTRVGLPIDYANGRYGILVEPEAVNILTRSMQLWNNEHWAGDPPFDLPSLHGVGSAEAPDGTLTASRFAWGPLLYGPPIVGAYRLHGTTAVSLVPYTFSFWYKSADGQPYRFGVRSRNGVGEYSSKFDALMTAGAAWQRARITRTIDSDDLPIHMGWDFRPGSFPGVDANGNILLWNPQLELGDVATSIMPTHGLAASRSSDNINTRSFFSFAGGPMQMPFSATHGSMFVDATPRGESPQVVAAVSRQDQDHIAILRRPSLEIVSGGVKRATVELTPGEWGANERGQFSAAWEVNNYAASLNGGPVVTHPDGVLPIWSNQTNQVIALGRRGFFGDPIFNGHIHRLVYVPRKVLNNQLANWMYAPTGTYVPPPPPAPPPPAVDAISKTNLRYHFRADVGVFSDLAGTVPAANNDGVAHWANSGTGGDAAALQTTAARRPTFKTGGLNGLPYLLCDRVTQQWFEDLNATQPTGVTAIVPFTVFIVTDAVGELTSLPAIQGDSVLSKFSTYFRSDANAQHHFVKAVAALRVGNVINPSILMFAAGRSASGVTSSPNTRFWIRQNGENIYSALQDTANLPSAASAAMQFLRYTGLGAGLGFFHGRIYEYLMYYNTTLNDDQTGVVEDYLAAKYGMLN